MASENRERGYERIVGASAILGYEISDQHSNFSCWHQASVGERKLLDWCATDWFLRLPIRS